MSRHRKRKGSAPRIWPFVVALGVLAYTVGTLFHRASVTEIALYRMFGTIGIVIMGILGGIIHARMQFAATRRELMARLDALRDVTPRELPDATAQRGRPQIVGLLEGSDGVWYLIGASAVPNFRGARFIARVQREAARLRKQIDEVKSAEAASGRERRVVGLLVLLRRRVTEAEDAAASVHGIIPANVEHLHPDLLVPASGAGASEATDLDGEETPHGESVHTRGGEPTDSLAGGESPPYSKSDRSGPSEAP